MNTPTGDRLFQDTPRRVAEFRENRPRDVEKSVDGKKKEKLECWQLWFNSQPDRRPPEAIPIAVTTNPERATNRCTENKLSFIRNPHVVISRQSPFAANVFPKLVAMATSLTPSISAVFIG